MRTKQKGKPNISLDPRLVISLQLMRFDPKIGE